MVYRTQLSPLSPVSFCFPKGKQSFLRSTRCLNRHNAFLFLFFFLLVDQRPLSSRATRFSRIRGKTTNDESWKDVITSGWRALLEERARKLYGSLDLSYYFTFIAFKQVPRYRFVEKKYSFDYSLRASRGELFPVND